MNPPESLPTDGIDCIIRTSPRSAMPSCAPLPKSTGCVQTEGPNLVQTHGRLGMSIVTVFLTEQYSVHVRPAAALLLGLFVSLALAPVSVWLAFGRLHFSTT